MLVQVDIIAYCLCTWPTRPITSGILSICTQSSCYIFKSQGLFYQGGLIVYGHIGLVQIAISDEELNCAAFKDRYMLGHTISIKRYRW